MIPHAFRQRLARSTPVVAIAALTFTSAVATGRQFESSRSLFELQNSTWFEPVGPLCTGDVNNDGRPDLVLRRASTASISQPTSLWLGSPSGLAGPILIPGVHEPANINEGSGYRDELAITALADIDLDENDDLITITGTTLQVRRSNGLGGFTLIQTILDAGLEFVAVDIDADQDTDIVAGFTDHGASPVLRVFRNHAGVLQPPVVFVLSDAVSNSFPPRPFIGRFSEGAGPDILFADSIFQNDGTGDLTRTQRPELASLNNIFAVIDLNNDGRHDLLRNATTGTTPPPGPVTPWWMIFNGAGGTVIAPAVWSPEAFVSQPALPMPMQGPFRARLLGPNHPLGSDLILYSAVTQDNTLANSCLITLTSIENGTFRFDETVPSEGVASFDVEVGDFTGDGCPDAVVFNDGVFLWVFENTADGQFGSRLTLIAGDCDSPRGFKSPVAAGTASFTDDLGLWLYRVVPTDFDNDGWIDLIVNRASNAPIGTGTNAGTNRHLYFRNLAGRFDFSKPVFFAPNTTNFGFVELHDLDGDQIREPYGTASTGTLEVRPLSAAGGLALPAFWDQAFTLTSVATPFVRPTPTGYSTSEHPGPFLSLAPGPLGLRSVFDADGNGVNEMVWFQNFGSVTNTTQPSRIVVQRTDGTGIRSTTPTKLASVAPIDFDADGDTDLVGIERPAGASSTACGCFYWSIEIRTGLGCACLSAGVFRAFLNDGTGQFTERVTTIPTPALSDLEWPALRTLDVTGDARPDLVLLSHNTAEIRVYPGTHDGLSPTPLITSTGSGCVDPAFADVDRDGDTDLVATRDYATVNGDPFALLIPQRLAVYLNNGDGTFTLDPNFAPLSAFDPALPALADFDNDNDPDLAFISANGLLTVAMNLTPPACSADFNNNGTVDTPDLTYFLARFGSTPTPGTPPARADFDASGAVDTADLIFFLGRFGQTCP